ncbi:hypothetical protein HUB98_16775 [Paenibacillus barcinonensis]|uniref:Uncharacterized protein n=1 Tax=Paenibacillus barcinonensis TaxID=198119 RepID=A0A2V4VUU9_PAEBA|nr:hypothetical protein [Paenibacillus barcinonensis]PYE48782.1 hypothetical protein DFQ00_10775 [Paenibacillus barcinonensis]QKS57790.1 hypothetical protein HUB98_16775 [Paenibacillus barcinonensis]
MGIHTLAKGIDLIAAIQKLGIILDYHVISESPVKKGETHQAVDVAWFIDKEDTNYPIMIFEVESYLTNASAANPLKIFSKSNHYFEKPLFFFHIFVKSGDDPAVLKDLEYQYGRNNYRIYEICKGDLNKLILDVISQHRRINKYINIQGLMKLFNFGEYWEEINITDVLVHIENLYKQSWNEIFPIYADLAQQLPSMHNEFTRFLDKKMNNGFNCNDNYEDYIAYHFSNGIYLAVLFCVKRDNAYLFMFKDWQENSSYMEMIGPYFGLSRDYDEFIEDCSGAYLGMLAVLFKHQSDGVKYILKQSIKILERMKGHPDKIVFYNAIWALHIAATCDICEQEYNYIRDFINQRGKVNKHWIEEPLSALDNTTMDNNESHSIEYEYISDLETFRLEFGHSDIIDSKIYKQEAVSLAIRMLSDLDCWSERRSKPVPDQDCAKSWGTGIINCLHFNDNDE